MKLQPYFGVSILNKVKSLDCRTSTDFYYFFRYFFKCVYSGSFCKITGKQLDNCTGNMVFPC